jgi:hypothetical protein
MARKMIGTVVNKKHSTFSIIIMATTETGTLNSSQLTKEYSMF